LILLSEHKGGQNITEVTQNFIWSLEKTYQYSLAESCQYHLLALTSALKKGLQDLVIEQGNFIRNPHIPLAPTC
jgi:hypothetical protein